jgi:hypothetical protein
VSATLHWCAPKQHAQVVRGVESVERQMKCNGRDVECVDFRVASVEQRHVECMECDVEFDVECDAKCVEGDAKL